MQLWQGEKQIKFGKTLLLRYNCIMKAPAKCGTRSGYNRHLRLNEEVCFDCREAQNSYDRQRHENDPEYFRIKNKRTENKEKKRARWRKREAMRKGSYVSSYLDSDVIDLYGTTCYICLQDIDMSASRRSGIGHNWEHGLHIDHIVPLSKGGPDCIENVRPAHAICNLKKGSKAITRER